MNQVGYLPVYSGHRYQKGGGILASIGRVLLPVVRQGAKALAKGVVKTAPGMIQSVIDGRATPKRALLQTVKKIGTHVVNDVGEEIFGNALPQQRKRQAARPLRGPTRKRQKRHGKILPQRKKRGQTRQRGDIFSA